MSAMDYEKRKKSKDFSYIDSRSRGIRNFLRHRSQSLTFERMINEVRLSIPSLQEKGPTAT